MVSIKISPHITLALNSSVFSQAYLEWVDAMMADPCEKLYYQAPSYGSTAWENGEWCLSLDVDHTYDSDGSYLHEETVIQVPLVGELAIRFRQLVADHLVEDPHYYRACHLSGVIEDRVHLHSEILFGDRTLEAVWLHQPAKVLGRQPLAEVVCHHSIDVNHSPHAWPHIHATRLVVSDGNHCTLVAPVVILLTEGEDTIETEIRCRHLILRDERLLTRLAGRLSYQRLSVMGADRLTRADYREDQGTLVQVETLVSPDVLADDGTQVTMGTRDLEGYRELMAPVAWDDQGIYTFRVWERQA